MLLVRLLGVSGLLCGSLLAQVVLPPKSPTNPFTITNYSLQGSIGEYVESSGNSPLLVDYSVFGLFGNPSLRITGTFGFYDGEDPFNPAARLVGPLSLRFTDALIECYGSTGNCGSFVLNLMANFTSANVTTNTAVPRFLGIEGSASLTTPQELRVSLGNSTNIVLSPLLGSSTFSESLALGSAFLLGNSSIRLGLNIPSLATGDSISLPNSLWYSFNSAVPTNIPEPGSVLLVGAAIAGAVWLRRNSRAN